MFRRVDWTSPDSNGSDHDNFTGVGDDGCFAGLTQEESLDDTACLGGERKILTYVPADLNGDGHGERWRGRSVERGFLPALAVEDLEIAGFARR